MVVLVVIVVVAAASGTAFALTRQGKACTLIGSINGVTVRLSAADLRKLKRAAVCVGDRCTRSKHPARRVFFPVKASGPKLVPVFLMLEREGEPADMRAVRVRLRRFEPNGPGCGTWWNRSLQSDEVPSVPAQRVPRRIAATPG